MNALNRVLSCGAGVAIMFSSITPMVASANSQTTSFKQPAYPKYTQHTTITWWSWTANADKVVQAFNKVYPDIKVIHQTVGAGPAEYTKLLTVLKAGTGAPDVVQIAYDYLPEFIETGGLVDISQYVNRYKSYYQPSTWSLVSRGDKVYGVPEDLGPDVLYYRPDVFTKYGLTVPKTWATFASDAAKLHNSNPHLSMAFFPTNDGPFIWALMSQDGVTPFKYENGKWQIQINNRAAKKVMNYWGDLVAKGYVKTDNDFTPEFGKNLAGGAYASFIGATWAPAYEIAPYVKADSSDWHATDSPQWAANGPFIAGNPGASANAVTSQSKNPEAAALFAAWINTSKAGNILGETASSQGGRGLDMADKYSIAIHQANAPLAILGGQNPASVFAKAKKSIDGSIQYSPWQSYVYSVLQVEFAKAAKGTESWSQALDNVQSNVVNFAKTQGYSVSQ